MNLVLKYLLTLLFPHLLGTTSLSPETKAKNVLPSVRVGLRQIHGKELSRLGIKRSALLAYASAGIHFRPNLELGIIVEAFMTEGSKKRDDFPYSRSAISDAGINLGLSKNIFSAGNNRFEMVIGVNYSRVEVKLRDQEYKLNDSNWGFGQTVSLIYLAQAGSIEVEIGSHLRRSVHELEQMGVNQAYYSPMLTYGLNFLL